MPPNPKRMTGKQLRALRESRGETLDEFGAWLSKIVGNDRAYTRQDVNAWESERRGRKLPMAIEMALLRKGEL